MGDEPGIDQANQAEVLDDFRQNPSMVQALDAERFHLTPPLNQLRVWGHSAEDKWFLPLLHLLNAGSIVAFCELRYRSWLVTPVMIDWCIRIFRDLLHKLLPHVAFVLVSIRPKRMVFRGVTLAY